MRNRCMTVAVGVVLGAAMAAGEAAAFSASYDQKVTQGRAVTNSKVSLKDDLFRMETTAQGQTAIILRNREGIFTVMPSEGMAMKTALHPGQGPIQGAEDYAQYLKERQAEYLGAETLNGHSCDVYRFTDPENGGEVKAWVSKEKMFPIRLEMEGDEGKMVVEISNIELGAALPESAFELPDGVQVMDMGALLNMH